MNTMGTLSQRQARNQRARSCVVLAALCVATALGAAHAGIPEPGITLYGRVTNDNGDLVTTGALTWTYTPPLGGTPVRQSTQLQVVFADGGPYSYILEIPAEQPVAGFPASANTMQLAAESVDYTRGATVQSVAAAVLGPQVVSLSSADRGAVERVDLMVQGIIVEAPPVPGAPNPLDGAARVPVTTALSWRSDAGVTGYDLYFWKASDPTPSTPLASGLLTAGYVFPQPLAYATTYNWQVLSRNTVGTTLGPQWTFTSTIPTTSSISSAPLPQSPPWERKTSSAGAASSRPTITRTRPSWPKADGINRQSGVSRWPFRPCSKT
ncbi:MAG TPA: hypothetical protein PKL84_05410, partial [Candidatus Hydrogenedentes bacterium]|nr:hypothetical protein [Candidatus Hydrogenedentota bacterium]